MKKTIFIFCVVWSFCITICVHAMYAAEKPVGSILVSLDFTEALAGTLVAGTGIEVIPSIPKDYDPSTHVDYIKKHFADFSEIARSADCVLGLPSVWPEDPLYLWARRANIRIVSIDAGSPLDGSRAGVPQLTMPEEQSGRLAPYAWNSPGNAARMADIAASNLIRLFPEQGKQIEGNLAKFKRALFQLRSKYETAFGELDAFEVVALTKNYYYLTDEFGLMVADFMLKPEIRWKPADLDQLGKSLVSGNIKGVLCAWEPNEAISAVIEKSGAHIIIATPFVLKEKQKYKKQLIAFYTKNLDALLKGLQ